MRHVERYLAREASVGNIKMSQIWKQRETRRSSRPVTRIKLNARSKFHEKSSIIRLWSLNKLLLELTTPWRLTWLRLRPTTYPVGLSQVIPSQEQQSVSSSQYANLGDKLGKVSFLNCSKADLWWSRHRWSGSGVCNDEKKKKKKKKCKRKMIGKKWWWTVTILIVVKRDRKQATYVICCRAKRLYI